jgi:hypothetical protein
MQEECRSIMKREMFQIKLLILCLLMLFGCTSNVISDNNTNIVNKSTMKKDITNVLNKTNSNVTDNRYIAAGIDNAAEFEDTFNTVKALVEEENKIEVAKYILYPIRAYIDGKSTMINNENDFIKNYDKIINTKIKDALSKENVRSTYVNSEGVMVDAGQIWFTQSQKCKNLYCIYTINN